MSSDLYPQVRDMVIKLKAKRNRARDVVKEASTLEEAEAHSESELDTLLIRSTWYEKEMSPLRPRVMKESGDPELHEKFSKLNDSYQKVQNRLKKHLRETYTEVDERIPSMVDMVLRKEGVDLTVIKSVLKTHEQVERGRLSREGGLERGLEFTKDYYGLPPEIMSSMRKYCKDNLGNIPRVGGGGDKGKGGKKKGRK